MAEFLTTNGTSYHIENIIIGAKRKLVLVSPYLQLSKTLFERLKDAAKRDVSIKITYGKDDLKPNEKNSLAELKNLELFYFENLHAKCYFNEFEMVITSMNMYEFSEKNNREMGVYITKEKDNELFDKAVTETISIIQSSERIQLSKSKRQFYQEKSHENKQEAKSIHKKSSLGYCIRCKCRILYNPKVPYCEDCFVIWAQYENPKFVENVCHCCGKDYPTTLDRSLCHECFKEYGR
jgi:hypothetical protein